MPLNVFFRHCPGVHKTLHFNIFKTIFYDILKTFFPGFRASWEVIDFLYNFRLLDESYFVKRKKANSLKISISQLRKWWHRHTNCTLGQYRTLQHSIREQTRFWLAGQLSTLLCSIKTVYWWWSTSKLKEKVTSDFFEMLTSWRGCSMLHIHYDLIRAKSSFKSLVQVQSYSMYLKYKSVFTS